MSEGSVASAWNLSKFLRMAVMAGVESAVQIHIDRGDDLDARDASGMTPLMLAAARNKSAMCRLLLNAGVDHRLLDPSGKTALEIAVAAGANDCAEILLAVHAPQPCTPLPEIAPDPATDPVDEPSPTDCPPRAEAATNEDEAVLAEPPDLEVLGAAVELEMVSRPFQVIDMGSSEDFDLSGWEAEQQVTPPEANLAVLASASAIQIAINAHVPIDSSAGWEDVDAYLPDQALPLARADDAEGRARLRRLLLRAIREGSVPDMNIEAMSTNDDRSPNPEAEAFLTMVVNDLGAEADERFEFIDACESFEVYVHPEETSEEEEILDEALGAIDRAASPRTEPLRIYQREFQRLRLLTAEEEIQIAQAMETALEAALDALAAWPEGIARTLAAGADALAGLRPLSSLWLGVTEPEPESSSVDIVDDSPSQVDLADEAASEEGEPVTDVPGGEGNDGFADSLQRLGVLTERGNGTHPTLQEVRQALAAVRLNRSFMLELDSAPAGLRPSRDFRRALIAFRKARDRMAVANLKLAFFHAKKYLYSGEPLDDLAQEANIGLLKAVDRYEWRRGFRFSTYATWWVRQQISRYVADKARTIRVPVHVHEKLQRLEREAESFRRAFAREATLRELAQRLEMPDHKVAALLHIAPEPSRIDDIPIDEMIAVDARDSYSLPDPADLVGEIDLRSAVDRFLSSLAKKDQQILRLRFGIGNERAHTLDEVGEIFDVTRERIRQIEAKAIRKLQNPVRAEDFLRQVLGVGQAQRPFTPAQEGLGRVDTAESTEPAKKSAPPKQKTSPPKQSAPPTKTHKPAQPSKASSPWTLDWLLAQANELQVPIDDGRLNSSGLIWVRLLDTPDNSHRRLARRLLEFGFQYLPQKGYWK